MCKISTGAVNKLNYFHKHSILLEENKSKRNFRSHFSNLGSMAETSKLYFLPNASSQNMKWQQVSIAQSQCVTDKSHQMKSL